MPKRIAALRKFGTNREAAELYRDGLVKGACEVSQPGTDPWRVRVENDPIEGFLVYLQWGRYNGAGMEVYD